MNLGGGGGGDMCVYGVISLTRKRFLWIMDYVEHSSLYSGAASPLIN